MCVCVGPPDTVAQGEPTVLINGTPVATMGSMTAHGGSITVGEPTVMVGSATPGAKATMPLNKILNPYDAQVRLWDLMVCTQMLFEPVDSKRTIYTSYSTIGTTSSSTVKYYSFDVTMEFMKFLDIDSDIQTHALLYANGFKNGNPQNISSQRAYDIRTDDKSKNILKIRLVIPTAYRSQVSELSDIIFAVRINFNNNEKITFPFIYKNKERYLGAKADLGTLVPIFGTKQNEEIRIGSMADLKTKEIWG